MKIDYLIVGSGLTGSVIARLLADAGRDVLIVERRSHLGGNVYDEVHPSGIRVHKYGPHYFRTESDDIWEFAKRFSSFYKYEASLMSYVDRAYEQWPVMEEYIVRIVGKEWRPAFRGIPRNFEEASLTMMPKIIYDKFVKGYTEKQWGVPASTLSVDLARRFDIRIDGDTRLSRHKHQGIPMNGYTKFMENMVSGIPVILNYDYLQNRDIIKPQRLLIFTGPIDEFFGFDYGKLKYRGQRREHQYLSNIQYHLPCGQINNPDPQNGKHIRTIEWKHMMQKDYAVRILGTVLTKEIPEDPEESDRYEYPFPNNNNRFLYEKYRKRANSIPKLLICGRLGEYRYYDMDQAIARAMELSDKILRQT